MNGRWITLASAAVLMVTLTACGGQTNQMDKRSGGENRMVQENRAGMERKSYETGFGNGKYWAGGDGHVTHRPKHAESEWEKMGRQLQDGFDDLINGAGDAAGDLGRGGKNAVQDVGRGLQDAARDVGNDVKRAESDMTR